MEFDESPATSVMCENAGGNTIDVCVESMIVSEPDVFTVTLYVGLMLHIWMRRP